MSNPFQDQLIKAGVASKQQVHNAKKDKKKKNKQQGSKNEKRADEARLKVQQATKEKAERDLELNKKKDAAAQQKAISAEINQLITAHGIKRGDDCEIVYNFEHRDKVKRIYINEEMKKQLMQGNLGIARIDGRYELVPKTIAEKIQQRNEKRVILFEDKEPAGDENDPYADYKIPDDLTW